MPKPNPNLPKTSPVIPPPALHLFRLRCTYESTHEGEPHYIVATCRESAVDLWYLLNMRDMEDPCELVIEKIRSVEEAHPA